MNILLVVREDDNDRWLLKFYYLIGSLNHEVRAAFFFKIRFSL